MKSWFLAALTFLVLLAPVALHAQAAPTRDEVLLALAVTDDQLPDIKSPKPPVIAPSEKDPYVLALQKFASERPDPELIITLLRYQLAYRSPENETPARAMGVVFFEQPSAFSDVFVRLPAAGRVVLGPYLKYGFDKAVEGRNPSTLKIKDARKKMDKLQADLMNARSRDDQG